MLLPRLEYAVWLSIFHKLIYFVGYLYVADKEDEARRILRKLRGPNADVTAEMDEYRQMNQVHKEHGSLLKSVMEKDIRAKLGITFVLAFIQAFSGKT